MKLQERQHGMWVFPNICNHRTLFLVNFIIGLKTFYEKPWYSGNITGSGLLKTIFKSQFLPILPLLTKFLSLDIIICKQGIFLT